MEDPLVGKYGFNNVLGWQFMQYVKPQDKLKKLNIL